MVTVFAKEQGTAEYVALGVHACVRRVLRDLRCATRDHSVRRVLNYQRRRRAG